MSESSIESTNGGKAGAAPRAGWWRRIRGIAGTSYGTVVGIDIGSRRTKVIVLRRVESAISLDQVALFPTSPEATTAGEFTNGLAVAEQLQAMWQAYGIKTSRAAVSVSGGKVFCQTRGLASDSHEYIESSVLSEAGRVVPYSLEAATLDYDIVSGPEGDQLLWVCAPTEQVEWMREVVDFAGKTPALVDAEACALANAFVVNNKPRKDAGSLMLHTGAGTLNACLLRGDALLCSRTARMHERTSQEAHEAQRVAAEAHRLWDLLSEQTQMDGVESIWVSGGGARDEVVDAISERFEVQADLFDPFREIDLTADSDVARVVEEHRAGCAVAVGLALRGFEDL